MIQHPGIVALLLGSLLASVLLLHAGWHGCAILRRWDPTSGSEAQVQLERRTSLITALVGLVLVLQLASLFLFVHTAEVLHDRLAGAMCAAGTLAANGYGYPALGVKLATSLLAGLWLLLNRADAQAPDQPLIRPKYTLLMVLVPLVLLETALQGAFFFSLKADVITSCCGSLFSAEGAGATAGLGALSLPWARILFFGTSALMLGAGLRFLRSGGTGGAFALAAGLAFVAALPVLIALIGPYVYETPTHACPFCMLQGEYHRVGYLFYGAWLVVGISGLGVGLLAPFRSRPSLAVIVPRMQRGLVVGALAGQGVFFGLGVLYLLFSTLRLS